MTAQSATGGDLLAAGTVGMTAGQAVLSIGQAVPGSFWSTLVSGLIGLAVVWIRTRYEATAGNRALRERIRDLEADVRFYRDRPKPSS